MSHLSAIAGSEAIRRNDALKRIVQEEASGAIMRCGTHAGPSTSTAGKSEDTRR